MANYGLDPLTFLRTILTWLKAPIIALRHTRLNSCDLTGNAECRRCDCVPDCVDLSDEKNCTYGSIDDLLLPFDFVRKQAKDKQFTCNTDKFFPPPPLPPFSMCNKPTTTMPLTSTSPSHPPSTAIPKPPITTPLKPVTTTSRNQPFPTTNQNRQFTPPTQPTPHTSWSKYDIEKLRELLELCQRSYQQQNHALICTQRLWNCLTNPQLCPKPTIPTSTTTTTTTQPRPVYPIVTPYYYDYYNGYDARWNWNYLFF